MHYYSKTQIMNIKRENYFVKMVLLRRKAQAGFSRVDSVCYRNVRRKAGNQAIK